MAAKVPSSDRIPAGYLLLDTVPSALALPAAKVLSVSRAADWQAELAVPLGGLLPIEFSTPEPEWILRVGDGVCAMATRVNGRVRVAYLPVDCLYSMPLNHRGFETFSEVILVDGKPSALVVNVDALLSAHRGWVNDYGIQEPHC